VTRSDFSTLTMSGAPEVQRREDYRVEVPVEDEAVCILRFERKFAHPGHAVRLELCDISAGGLSLADYDQRLADALGCLVKDCELILPGQRRAVLVNLRLLRTRTEPLMNRLALARVSARFFDLSDTASLAIGRYVADVQRRQLAQRHDPQ